MAGSTPNILQRFEAVLDQFRELKTPSLATRLARMQHVVDGFGDLQETAAAERLPRMQGAVDEFEDLMARRPARFNILSLLNVRPDEVVHSGILAWLLDPLGRHGQGSLFLDLLLEELGVEVRPSPQIGWLVVPEFSGAESRVDICICRTGDLLIFIENKIWAGEGPGQADREIGDLRRTGRAYGIPEPRQIPVFLTVDGRRPTSGAPDCWHPLSYPRLAKVFHAALPLITDGKVLAFVSDWLATITEWSVNE